MRRTLLLLSILAPSTALADPAIFRDARKGWIGAPFVNQPNGLAGLDNNGANSAPINISGAQTRPFRISVTHNDPNITSLLNYSWTWDTPGTAYKQNAGLAGTCTVPSMDTPMSLYCHQAVLINNGYGGPISAASNVVAIVPAITDTHGPRSQTAAVNLAVIDQTGLPSSKAGALEGAEIDLYATGKDDVGNFRTGLMILAGLPQGAASGATMDVGQGLLMASGGDSSFQRAISFSAGFSVAGIDLSGGWSINNAPAIRFRPGQALDLTGDNKTLIAGDSAGNIDITAGGASTPTLQVQPAGDTVATGNVQVGKAKSFVLTAKDGSMTYLYSPSAGLAQLTGSVALSGSVSATQFIGTAATYATLPTGVAGMQAYCSNCYSTANPSKIQGIPVWWNGTAWTDALGAAVGHP